MKLRSVSDAIPLPGGIAQVYQVVVTAHDMTTSPIYEQAGKL